MFEDERIKLQTAGEIYLYTVKPGDNIYRIARMYNSKIEWIACMNNLNMQMMIYPHQNLYIPVINEPGPLKPVQPNSYDMYF